MRCIRCHSRRVIRFIDGFGQLRFFCRECQESFTITDVINIKYGLNNSRKLTEFINLKPKLLTPTLR